MFPLLLYRLFENNGNEMENTQTKSLKYPTGSFKKVWDIFNL